MTTKSELETDLLVFLRENGIPPSATNFPVAQDRSWTCDMVWIEKKVALEVEGGVFIGGRHTRGKGYTDDCEKYNALQINGWVVLRYTTTHLRKKNRHRLLADLKAVLAGREDMGSVAGG